MAFRNLRNRPSSALRFQWDCLEQLSFVIDKCQEGRDFPEGEGVVGIKSFCNCCSALGAKVLENLSASFPIVDIYKATGVARIGSGSTSPVLPAAGFSNAPQGTKNVEIFAWGFYSFSPPSCAPTEDLMDLGGLCRSIIVRNC